MSADPSDPYSFEVQLFETIQGLGKLCDECTPAAPPSPDTLLTLRELLKLRSRDGDFAALAQRVEALERRIELLGVKTIYGRRGQPEST